MPNNKEGVRAWDLKSVFLDKIEHAGGWYNCHAHLDKALLITEENLVKSQINMEDKWKLYNKIKLNYTHVDLVNRMSEVVESMIIQGVKGIRTCVDVDKNVELKTITAALVVKSRYKKQIDLQIATNSCEPLADKKNREIFANAAELADVICSIPSVDRGEEAEHLKFIFDLAEKLDKPIDMHVDQENNPDQHETIDLAKYAIKRKFAPGRVTAIHALSIACYGERKLAQTINLIKKSGMNIVVCPSAVISMKQLTKIAPLHNSITPVDKLIEAGVKVFKLEGRGRSADYVYTVTKCYRDAADSVLEGNYTEEKIKGWTKKLESVYNRGFWHGGYYLGKKLGEWSGVYGSNATKEKIFVGIFGERN